MQSASVRWRQLAWALGLVLVATATPAAEQAVRINADQAGRLPAQLAQRATSYGSYLWLRTDAAGLQQLERAGVQYSLARDSGVISFGQQRFDPLAPGRLEPRAARSTAEGKSLRLLQLNAPVRQEWLDSLRDGGVEVLQYYPNNAYLLWADHAAAARGATFPFTRWLGEFSPDWKYGAELKGRLGPIDNVVVSFYNDGDVAATLNAIASTGVRLIRDFPAQPDRKFHDAIVAADAGQLALLADLPQVVALGYSSPRAYFDDEASNQIAAGNYAPSVAPGYVNFLTELGLDGTGVTWAVTDSGVDLGHPEFAGRLTGFTYPGCPAGAGAGDDNSAGGHGTHVAGIIAGAGTLANVDANGFKYGLGIAPAAAIHSLNPICTGSVPWPPAGGWQTLSKQALAGNAIGSNNSWTSGEGSGVGYIATARTFDFMARDGDFDTPLVNEPFIMVFSAGNSGSGASTITSPKEAKNIISVANSNNTRAGSIELVASSSSRGPAADGRILPVITAPGSQIASTRRRAGASQCGTAIAGTDGNFSLCSGTSMASPHAAGLAVLLTQWWRENFDNATPSPAMVRALLVNGAVDLTGPGAIPNNIEGWGRVHLQNSLAADRSRELIDQTELLTDVGSVFERSLGVPDSGKGVRITLAWTDAPGAIGAAPALVNNLDLEVIADGQTYLGNVFSNSQSTTGGTADALHNTENVYLPAGVSSVVVRVKATSLNADGVPNTGDATDQDFALVCDNCLAEPAYTLSADTSTVSLCVGGSFSREVQLGQLLGFNSPVTLSSSGVPAPAVVSFTPNPVNVLPGTSTLQVDLGFSQPGSQTLQVNAVSGSIQRSLSLPLFIAGGPVSAPQLTTPANGSGNIPANVQLQWNAQPQAFDYLVEIARDANFSDLIESAVLRGNSFTPSAPLPTNSVIYWRVTARNACGLQERLFYSGFEAGEGGAASSVGSFTTAAAPGDCPIGSTQQIVFSEDMESGAPGWSSAGTLNSWALNGSFPHTGTQSYRAVGAAAVSDQQLTSPSIVLPAAQQGLYLKFWNRQHLEARSGGGCWDGGQLQISVGGGAFNQVGNALLLTDPYDGALTAPNPGAPALGWCGDPQEFLNSVVNLADFAGQSVRLRFRLTSDDSVFRPDGWSIDDVQVVSCSN